MSILRSSGYERGKSRLTLGIAIILKLLGISRVALTMNLTETGDGGCQDAANLFVHLSETGRPLNVIKLYFQSHVIGAK